MKFLMGAKERGDRRLRKNFIRRSLDVIILSLLKEKSMSGFEIIKLIHERFGILLSAGTVYPLLHSLKDEGILKTTRSGKNIIYKIKSKKKAGKILDGHLESYEMLKKLSKK